MSPVYLKWIRSKKDETTFDCGKRIQLLNLIGFVLFLFFYLCIELSISINLKKICKNTFENVHWMGCGEFSCAFVWQNRRNYCVKISFLNNKFSHETIRIENIFCHSFVICKYPVLLFCKRRQFLLNFSRHWTIESCTYMTTNNTINKWMM